MATKYEHEFSVRETGERTGDPFVGKFKVKTRLSHRDTLNEDSIRRRLLTEIPGTPSTAAANLASIFAQLAVRILEAPSWWTNSDNGMDLTDDVPVSAVYRATIKAEQDVIDAAIKKAEDAKKDIADVQDE